MSKDAARDESRIGDFVVENEIGKGSFAVVHKGYRVSPRESVAIKIVTRKKLTPKLLDNLEGEIAILKAIHHPNIVELKECLKTDTQIYLVMPFCASGDLSQYIKKRYDIYERAGLAQPVHTTAAAAYPHPIDGGLNETIVRSILAQLAAALEFMRARDIVHRDIKPQNLLLQPPDQSFLALGNPRQIPQVKVADFGFARHLSANVLAETLCGSPLYMAPEILRYEKYDAKADLWSVGAVLFEMTVGKPPFKASNHVELLKRIEKGQDKIKFPDERSAGSIAREAARRDELGEAPLPPPHSVSDDIKTLIRQLLRQKPVSRMSFDEFFCNPVIEHFNAFTRLEAQPLAAEKYADMQRSERRTLVTSSSGIQEASVTSIGSGSGHQATVITAAPSPSRTETPPMRRQTSSSSDTRARPLPRAFAARYVTGESAADAEPAKSTVTPALPNTMGARTASQRQADSPSPTAGPQPAEDSMLGKEYVMVEKRSVEVNALADELAAFPQSRPSTVARRPSRLSRLSSGAGPSSAAVASGVPQASPIRIAGANGSAWPAAGPFALPPGARPSSFPRRTSLSSSGSPSPRVSGQTIAALEANASSRKDSGHVPSPHEDLNIIGTKMPTLSPAGPSSALSRAISMTSLRLFGVPSGMSLREAATLIRTRAQRRAGFLRSNKATDEAESQLLSTLEDLGQKSLVLSEFADSKMASYFPEGPHQNSVDFDSFVSTGVSPGRTSGYHGTAARTGSTSSSSSALDSMAAEAAAAEALVIYVRCLLFLQRGIALTKTFLEARSGPELHASASAELNEVVQWLRARFNEGYDKADFARSKCGEIPESAQQVDKLIFDKAVEVAKAAATDELENNREGSGWDAGHCLLAYETASSMLSSLLDPGEDAMSLSEGSICMIEKYVKSINKRLAALQHQLHTATGSTTAAQAALLAPPHGTPPPLPAQ